MWIVGALSRPRVPRRLLAALACAVLLVGCQGARPDGTVGETRSDPASADGPQVLGGPGAVATRGRASVDLGAYADDARVVALAERWPEIVDRAVARLPQATGLAFPPTKPPRVRLAPLGDEYLDYVVTAAIQEGRRVPVLTVNVEPLAAGRRDVETVLMRGLAAAVFEDTTQRLGAPPAYVVTAAETVAAGDFADLLVRLARDARDAPPAVDPGDPRAARATAAAALILLQPSGDDALRRFLRFTAEGDDPDDLLARVVRDPVGAWAGRGRAALAERLERVDTAPWRLLARAREALREAGRGAMESVLPQTLPPEIAAEITVLRAQAHADEGDYESVRRLLETFASGGTDRLEDAGAAAALRVRAERASGGDARLAARLEAEWLRDYPRLAARRAATDVDRGAGPSNLATGEAARRSVARRARGRCRESHARGAGRASARTGARRRAAGRRRRPSRRRAPRPSRRIDSGYARGGRGAAPRRPPRCVPAARRLRSRSVRRCPRPRGRSGARGCGCWARRVARDGPSSSWGRCGADAPISWRATSTRCSPPRRGRSSACGCEGVAGDGARGGHGLGAAAVRHRRGVDPRASAGAQRPAQHVVSRATRGVRHRGGRRSRHAGPRRARSPRRGAPDAPGGRGGRGTAGVRRPDPGRPSGRRVDGPSGRLPRRGARRGRRRAGPAPHRLPPGPVRPRPPRRRRSPVRAGRARPRRPGRARAGTPGSRARGARPLRGPPAGTRSPAGRTGRGRGARGRGPPTPAGRPRPGPALPRPAADQPAGRPLRARHVPRGGARAPGRRPPVGGPGRTVSPAPDLEGEDRALAEVFAVLAGEVAPRFEVGPGHDCAVLALPSPRVVVTTDVLVDGVHFELAACGPEAAAAKSLLVNLSDLAAAAAVPLAFEVGVVLPRVRDADLLLRLARGLAAVAARYDCPCAGGDTNVADAPLTLAVTAFGSVGAGGVVTRSGARVGDVLSVTGPLGGSGAGRHLDFVPRLAEARAWSRGACRTR